MRNLVGVGLKMGARSGCAFQLDQSRAFPHGDINPGPWLRAISSFHVFGTGKEHHSVQGKNKSFYHSEKSQLAPEH